jgi:carbamoyl-phosphate synthase large subunit
VAQPRTVSRSEISVFAAGFALGVAVAALWNRSAARANGAEEASPSDVLATPAVPAERVVLVTGAGGAAGICVVRALKAAGARVIAADLDSTAAGLQLADAGAAIPPPDEPDFVAAVCELAVAHGAQVVVSTVPEELPVLAEGREALAAAGLASWLPDPAAVRTCLDRWAFTQAVAAAGICHPPTSLGRADDVPGPWIVKPRFGRGSRHVFAVDYPPELSWAIAYTSDAIVQTRLEGLEFSIDALVDRGGVLAAAVPRWLLETEDGSSTKARTFEDPELVVQAESLVAALGLEGPVNVRGFMLSSNGLYCFTEVTPGFSSGLSLSLAAGADLVGEYVRGIYGLPLRRERLVHRPGCS